MLRYTTVQGDTLDMICWRHYGATAGVVEAVLAANRGLGALGAVYAAGVEILLPERPTVAPAVTVPVRLWD